MRAPIAIGGGIVIESSSHTLIFKPHARAVANDNEISPTLLSCLPMLGLSSL